MKMTTNITSMMIMIIFLTIMFNMNQKKKKYIQKSTPFECGFNPFNNKRTPTSMQFYIISIMFMIFDLEIMMIMITLMSKKSTPCQSWTLNSSMLMLFLILSIIIEWKTKKMNWMK